MLPNSVRPPSLRRLAAYPAGDVRSPAPGAPGSFLHRYGLINVTNLIEDNRWLVVHHFSVGKLRIKSQSMTFVTVIFERYRQHGNAAIIADVAIIAFKLDVAVHRMLDALCTYMILVIKY